MAKIIQFPKPDYALKEVPAEHSDEAPISYNPRGDLQFLLTIERYQKAGKFGKRMITVPYKDIRKLTPNQLKNYLWAVYEIDLTMLIGDQVVANLVPYYFDVLTNEFKEGTDADNMNLWTVFADPTVTNNELAPLIGFFGTKPRFQDRELAADVDMTVWYAEESPKLPRFVEGRVCQDVVVREIERRQGLEE